ncbi:hypothetical protein GOB93_08145 [Acetobacter musti]|uniref:Uncharacterized protein n=1 Tax=Acetobacter musti TaxID=864732 RepID=A0ABX0JNN9_9PROT|nr:hypothetical protein [Acetobacter musti]NHN84615.1 hypothetical protein [Acetobacter musti]
MGLSATSRASFLSRSAGDEEAEVSVAGPGIMPFDLLFRPLWPLVVPSAQWRRSLKESTTRIPDTLLEPLRIWMFDCYPEADLVLRLIESGNGSRLPARDPLEEPEWADPVQRASELLWARAAAVLSRPVPPTVLDEMAVTAGLKTTDITGLLPSLAVLFAEAPLLFPHGSSPVPAVADRSGLLAALTRIAGTGILAWTFAMPLLLAARNEIDIVLPAARTVALSFAHKGRYVAACDEALAEVFPLFEARCTKILQDLKGVKAVAREGRRVTLWLEVPDLATILSLIRFANRCSVHVLPAAQLRSVAARACRLQFDLLVAEDLLIHWPRASWPDSLMIAFERGNRRLRNLASIGGGLSRPADYRDSLKRLAKRVLDDVHLGLSIVERMRTAESLIDLRRPSALLVDYLALLPPPADERPSVRRVQKETVRGLQPWNEL